MAALLATTWVGFQAQTDAAPFEQLLMPGKLTRAHEKLESDCSACHDRSDRARQSALCLDCHEEVRTDVRRKSGFHGRLPNVATAQCTACHSEHLGRDADIVKLDPAAFDHGSTDMPLDGAHRTLECEACHVQGKLYRTAPTQCGACHESEDLHAGQLGRNCGTCHSSVSWSGGRMDHDKTSFPLRDRHRQVDCYGCHVDGRYDGAPTRCVDCHMPDDVHLGSRGESCGECHTAAGWQTAKFDHAGETGFALLGTHARLPCAACHVSGKLEEPLPRDCFGCHRADDSHARRFGGKCQDCHGNEAWKGTPFDHEKRTQFALLDAHAEIDCHACHTAATAAQELATDCAGCHRADDVHGGQLREACDICHGMTSWRDDLAFDHDLTDFPLLGMHVVVSCAQCHASKSFADTKSECVACHSQDDVHKGRLGRDCAACHSSNAWAIWEFDHSKTGFALTGAHNRITCTDCHRQPAGEVRLPEDCGTCHRNEDIHLGQYGTQCQRCHTTITFKGARIQ